MLRFLRRREEPAVLRTSGPPHACIAACRGRFCHRSNRPPKAGEGAPVVLLHGFPETSYAWRHQIPELARKYRVIAPDLRGYDETDKPATGYDKRNMANDLRELMRSLEIPKIALVGQCWKFR
jgi:pimeloyl-ACP methyl ester carboxylesterase